MSTRSLQLLVCAIMALAWPDEIRAHMDTPIRLDGLDLVGLPKYYGPARFDVEAGKLRIGRWTMTLPPRLKRLFDQSHDLGLSASWYHPKNILPPYLAIRIEPKKKDFSYSILINLDTLEVIYVTVTVQESETTSHTSTVELSARERAEIKKSIVKVKAGGPNPGP